MNKFDITHSDKDFAFWMNREFISNETKSAIEKSNFLIVPLCNFRNYEQPLFYREVGDLISYLRDNQHNDINAEICINDEDYKEVSFCSDEIRLGEIVITSVILPIAVNLLTDFIKYYIKKKRMDKNKATVEIKITVSDKKKTKSLNYSGSAEEFIKTSPKITDLWNSK
ncbi:MAG: hypothetical protein LIP05_14970 [Tannerellaceae bacterium]|nr:hypothetical protein [Tannerellaceae bacterium]